MQLNVMTMWERQIVAEAVGILKENWGKSCIFERLLSNDNAKNVWNLFPKLEAKLSLKIFGYAQFLDSDFLFRFLTPC